MKIRKAVSADVAAVMALRKAAILAQCAGYYSTASLQIWTDGGPGPDFVAALDRHGYVAEIDGVLAASGMIDLRDGKIDAIFVDPVRMGSGIGRRMLTHLERLARQAGLVRVHLDATLNAADFYRTCGFTGSGQALYRSPRGIVLECVPMSKDL
ncbi:GNAT family N-acetyltransferase [Paludibacterium yongneupense]|uniref:GNAT family N-acetyltransferase n=1 Tax=Paludibacterium yongneupense TaxID=400061 RepID=UPI00048ABFA5|nr:GNAT family N-acetyltransferase [Paludibacterium yongneupense]